MGRVARGAQCRWMRGVLSTIAIAVALAAWALPTSALADAPAQGQYTPPDVSASGGSGHPRNSTGPAVPTASSSGGGNAALPILLGGVMVIGGAGAVILYRRQRSDRNAAE